MQITLNDMNVLNTKDIKYGKKDIQKYENKTYCTVSPNE